MKFGIFFQQQLPRPWAADSEYRVFQMNLDLVELSDKLGFDVVWATEHHFLEEYSHSSAPEIFLAAASQRTKRIRLGHGVVVMPPGFSHPARVAERISTLDVISGGRVEFGAGESGTRYELEAFQVDPNHKRAMTLEALAEVCKMMTTSPYRGHQGRWFEMPPRNVVPKPMQKPHPPLWLGCSSRESIRRAAKLGAGALTFAFVSPDEAKSWVDEYYHIIRTECTPIGAAINANVAMVVDMHCHEDQKEAERRGKESALLMRYMIEHYYSAGEHVAGETNVFERFLSSKTAQGVAEGLIGTPMKILKHIRLYAEAGIDQMNFIIHYNKDEYLKESLTLFAKTVLPTCKMDERQNSLKKQQRLAAIGNL